MPTDSTTAVADIQLSDEVLTFCRNNDLMDHLGRAIDLARRYFSIVGDPVVRLVQDPEIDEWYLDVVIRVEGDEEARARADWEFLRSWATSTPWPAVHLIRLFFEIGTP